MFLLDPVPTYWVFVLATRTDSALVPGDSDLRPPAGQNPRCFP